MNSYTMLTPSTDVKASLNSNHKVITEEVGAPRKRKLSADEEEDYFMEDKYSLTAPPRRTLERPVILDSFIPLTPCQIPPNASSSEELSDATIVHGHMLLTTLESGLVLDDEEPVKLIFYAVRNLLKEIITAVLSRRNVYKLHENRFRYSMGCPPVSVYLPHVHKSPGNTQDSLSQADHIPMSPLANNQIFQSDGENTSDASCNTNVVKQRPPVTAWDLLDALQVYPDAIPNHSVYAPSVEKIIAKLFHPSEDDLKFELLHSKQEGQKHPMGTQKKPVTTNIKNLHNKMNGVRIFI